MSLSLSLSLFATFLSVVAFLPYLRDMFLRKTTPHLYTWLIWGITQGTAVFGMIAGGGAVASISFAVATVLVLFVCICSLWYGTKHITRSDTVLLFVVFGAIALWWFLNNPLLSVILVTVVDLIGYIPSIKKAYKEPQSETLSTWVLFSVSNVFAVLALSEFNFLTLTYITAVTIGNMAIVGVLTYRRYL